MTAHSVRGKACLVTGAGAGLGRAMALGLAEAGAFVIGADVDGAAAQEAAQQANTAAHGGRMIAQVCDVRDAAQCEKAVEAAREAFGSIDVLVNCAGLNMAIFSKDFLTDPVRFWNVDPGKWQMLYDVNVRGPFLLSRAAAPHMIARKWGRIVNITTSYSTMMREGNTPYGQAKAAMEAASACWAEDLAGTGVTCNVLIPGGAADTAMIPADAPVERSRLVSPQAMIAPLCYLASSASDDVSGKRIIARDWNPQSPVQENIERAVAPAAWPVLAGSASPGAPVRKSVVNR
ncbi:MAG: SDR family oxidoreductase [Alphaproteobacteria bacterium]|nr:SDR family oxidoreductase [Alphaproteobacteria bacterium]